METIQMCIRDSVNTIIKACEYLLPELASKLAPGKDIYATEKYYHIIFAVIDKRMAFQSDIAILISRCV